jgi:hypothetical protein
MRSALADKTSAMMDATVTTTVVIEIKRLRIALPPQFGQPVSGWLDFAYILGQTCKPGD